jgi:hypothetical protein
VADSAPNGAKIFNRDRYEPQLQTCGGSRSLRGWTDATADVEFNSIKPPAQVATDVNQKMLAAAWTRGHSVVGDGHWAQQWTKRLTNRKTADTLLDLEEIDGSTSIWSLSASGPPDGRELDGMCGDG